MTLGRDEKRLDAFSTIKTISESSVMPSLHIPAIAPSEPRPVLSTLRRLAQCIVTSTRLLFAGPLRRETLT
jgi:hypothetical protein